MKLQNSSPMVDRVRVELTSRGGLYPALPSATYPYMYKTLFSPKKRLEYYNLL